MLAILASLLLVPAEADKPFPEGSPALIEACLRNAADAEEVSETDDGTKFLCVGEPAEHLWAFLEKAKIASWEQDTGKDGIWLSRSFPLGGCFKRFRNADGSVATSGLSCSIWIPRPTRAAK